MPFYPPQHPGLIFSTSAIESIVQNLNFAFLELGIMLSISRLLLLADASRCVHVINS
jgi:hypothetical protein